MIKRITSWLTRYGRTYSVKDEDGTIWYNDCDMIDGCMHDLDFDENARAIVSKMVDEWITDIYLVEYR